MCVWNKFSHDEHDVPVGVGAPPLDTKIIFWELNIVIITLVKVILAINHNTK